MKEQPFRETQRFPWWVPAFTLLSTALFGGIAVVQLGFGVPVGNHPASDTGVIVLFLVFGIGLPLLFYRLRCVIEAGDDGLSIRLMPFYRKTVPYADIRSCRLVPGPALLEYGGFGIRFRDGKTALVMAKTEHAVELAAARGKLYVLAVTDAQRLAETLRERCGGFGPDV